MSVLSKRASLTAAIAAACAVHAGPAAAQLCSEEDGCDNTVVAIYSGVLGGQYNTITSSDYCVVAGGKSNELNSGAPYSAIAGGYSNWMNNTPCAFVGGGRLNATDVGSDPSFWEAVEDPSVGGGVNNHANSSSSTVGGGAGNFAEGGMVGASGDFETIVGGAENMCFGAGSAIGGGYGNQVSPSFYNGIIQTIVGGYSNTASGDASTVLGGSANTADGDYSVTAGGAQNSAHGRFSFAAGNHANADQDGCFVWADYSGYTQPCKIYPKYSSSYAAPNAFVARAIGGVEFITNVNGSGTPIAGVYLAAGGSVWYNVSDGNRKEDFQEVSPRDVLRKLAAIPVTTWKYNSEVSGARHMGPMAQDLYAAFGLGDDDKHVTSIDEAGVVMASIQGLDGVIRDADGPLGAAAARVRAEEEAHAKLAGARAGTDRALSSAEDWASAIEARLGISE